MSKFSFTAFMFLIGSILLIGFQSIAKLMGTNGGWNHFSLIQLFGKKYFAWINDISLFGLEDALMYIATMPLFVFLFCVSVLFFIIDKLYSK